MFPHKEPANQMADTSLLGYLGVIMTVLVVGVALAGLVLKLHSDTNRRIDDTNKRIDELALRMVEIEKGQARLEGYLAGLQTHTSPTNV